MEFKYYDVLSSLVVGYVLLVIGMYAFQIEYNSDYTVAYLAMAFSDAFARHPESDK